MSIEALNQHYLAEHERRKEVLHRFDKFTPDSDQIAAMDDVRSMFRSVAQTIMIETKPGREQSLALTALEEAKYWANQAIAKDGTTYADAVPTIPLVSA